MKFTFWHVLEILIIADSLIRIISGSGTWFDWIVVVAEAVIMVTRILQMAHKKNESRNNDENDGLS